MRRPAAFTTALIAALSMACAKADKPAQDTARPDVPTSVRYDAELDVYYVANVRSNPSRPDNAGYIARVGADSTGGMTVLAEGGRGGVTLRAPRGLALRGDTIYVADIDTVRMFDRHNGAALGSVSIATKAAFPNELLDADDGWYITDLAVVRSADGATGTALSKSANTLPALIGAANAAMAGPVSAVARTHIELTPTRAASDADRTRARRVAEQLRSALRKYADTAVAVADGYQKLMSNLAGQRTLHFTNYRNALAEAYRFDPARPTSILYQRQSDGSLRIIGAMFTAPRRMRPERLDERIPLSVARWHRHTNWCLPAGREAHRLTEQRDGLPLFGPDSPVATRRECEAVGGVFHPSLFGWMVHANVFLGDDLHAVFGDHH